MKAKFMATANLKVITKRTVSVNKYINKMAQPSLNVYVHAKERVVNLPSDAPATDC